MCFLPSLLLFKAMKFKEYFRSGEEEEVEDLSHVLQRLIVLMAKFALKEFAAKVVHLIQIATTLNMNAKHQQDLVLPFNVPQMQIVQMLPKHAIVEDTVPLEGEEEEVEEEIELDKESIL